MDEHSSQHPPPSEGPQNYDWAHIGINKKGVFARIMVPFISTKYKTDMTMHCILRAFEEELAPEHEIQLQNEETPLIDDTPNNELWRSPAMKREFHWDTFFSLYYIHLHRAAPLLFKRLRTDLFHLSEAHYTHQFTLPLRPIDGLGFSGSLFFFSSDRSLIAKSIGRKFEYQFLYTSMLDAYATYFLKHPTTLLSEITDILYSFDHRLGGYLGISPAHYMLMTNVLEGLDDSRNCRKWDLKPQSFFEPTRDLVPDNLKSEAAKSGLADELDEAMVFSKKQKEEFFEVLERDTEFLADMETIDYSLLLGRYPAEMFHEEPDPELERDPMVLGNGWRGGVRSADGKWVYKMCILDFLWNIHSGVRPKAARAAGTVLPDQTVTTGPATYRKEFLKMMEEYIVVKDPVDLEGRR